jgi:hypothetical protein
VIIAGVVASSASCSSDVHQSELEFHRRRIVVAVVVFFLVGQQQQGRRRRGSSSSRGRADIAGLLLSVVKLKYRGRANCWPMPDRSS